MWRVFHGVGQCVEQGMIVRWEPSGMLIFLYIWDGWFIALWWDGIWGVGLWWETWELKDMGGGMVWV